MSDLDRNSAGLRFEVVPDGSTPPAHALVSAIPYNPSGATEVSFDIYPWTPNAAQRFGFRIDTGAAGITATVVGEHDGGLNLVPAGAGQVAISGVTISGLYGFNVMTYGATGNGNVDDSLAIQAAISAAQAVHGVVLIPAGTYLISQTLTPNSLGTFGILGMGPEHSILRAAASFSGTWLADLTFTGSAPNVAVSGIELDLTLNPTLNGLRLGNSHAGSQTDGARVTDFKTRYGAYALSIDGGCATFMIRDCRFLNSTLGWHITNSLGTASPSGGIDNVMVTNTDTTVVTTQGLLIDTYLTGLAMNNHRVLGTASSVFSAGVVVNVSTPTGFNGEFIQATNCITDGITGPGLELINCRQFQSSNNFWSCLLNTSNYGVVLNGGSYFRFVNDEISGCGVQYLNAPDDIGFSLCEFPATGSVAGAHNMPGGSPPTNIQIDLGTLNYNSHQTGYQLTNTLSSFYTALTDPASLRMVEEQLTNGPVIESFEVKRINTNNTTLTLGNIFMQRIWLPRGLPVNTLTWMTGSTPFTAGSTTHYWMALYAASGGLASGAALVQSTDNTGPTLAASTLQAVPLSAQYVIPTSTYYYIALFLSSTGGSPTAPTVMNFGGISAVTNLNPKVCYVQQTAYASGTAPSVSGSASSLGNEIWVGVA